MKFLFIFDLVDKTLHDQHPALFCNLIFPTALDTPFPSRSPLFLSCLGVSYFSCFPPQLLPFLYKSLNPLHFFKKMQSGIKFYVSHSFPHSSLVKTDLGVFCEFRCYPVPHPIHNSVMAFITLFYWVFLLVFFTSQAGDILKGRDYYSFPPVVLLMSSLCLNHTHWVEFQRSCSHNNAFSWAGWASSLQGSLLFLQIPSR